MNKKGFSLILTLIIIALAVIVLIIEGIAIFKQLSRDNELEKQQLIKMGVNKENLPLPGQE